ncbi:hypothetical protein [Streptomyces canus]|uniref:hypothetical protein n=1 Tax=Streptomyces canus TaxID=58343 RepID=UPI00324CEB4F
MLGRPLGRRPALLVTLGRRLLAVAGRRLGLLVLLGGRVFSCALSLPWSARTGTAAARPTPVPAPPLPQPACSKSSGGSTPAREG